MMGPITVPPGCTGIELPNGKKLDANRQGKISVDDTRVQKIADRSTVGTLGIIGGKHVGFGHVQANSATCVDCGFNGWSWQTACPKCSGTMTKETQ